MASQKQREELPAKLIALWMEMLGLRYEDAMNTPEFWLVYFLDEVQYAEFRRKALFLIQKTLRCNRSKAITALDLYVADLRLRIG